MAWSVPGMEGDADMSLSASMDGNFMKLVSKSSFPGLEMVETAYLGWDADKSMYRMWTFANISHMPRVEHGTLSGDTLVMTSEPWNTGMGEPTVSRSTLSKVSATEAKLLLEFKMGEDWVKVAEGTFKKKA